MPISRSIFVTENGSIFWAHLYTAVRNNVWPVLSVDVANYFLNSTQHRGFVIGIFCDPDAVPDHYVTASIQPCHILLRRTFCRCIPRDRLAACFFWRGGASVWQGPCQQRRTRQSKNPHDHFKTIGQSERWKIIVFSSVRIGSISRDHGLLLSFESKTPALQTVQRVLPRSLYA